MEHLEWIFCEEDLPETGEMVLVTDGKRVDVGYWEDDDGLCLWDSEFSFIDPFDVTHWMPFPVDPRQIGKI